jgi:hypothetical protein
MKQEFKLPKRITKRDNWRWIPSTYSGITFNAHFIRTYIGIEWGYWTVKIPTSSIFRRLFM